MTKTVQTELEARNLKVGGIIFPVVSVTEPSNPVEGQTWWKPIGSGDDVKYFIFHGGAWQEISEVQAETNFTRLNTSAISSGEIVSGKISASTILGYFDNRFNGANLEGISKIENGTVRTDFNIKGTKQTGYVEMNPLGFAGAIIGEDDMPINMFELNSGGMFLQNGKERVRLSNEDLVDSGWVTLDIKNGANAKVRVRKRLGRVTVDFWVNSPKFGNKPENVIAVLPPEFRFSSDFSEFIGDNSLTGKGKVRISANGEIKMWSGDNPTSSYASVIEYPIFSY